jgi:hypothetical protein
MALVKFKVQTQGAPPPGVKLPAVVSNGVRNLHPGDRLLFESDNGTDVLVDLGDEETGTLVALVKHKGGPNFEVSVLPGPDNRPVVKLNKPGGNDSPTDPPH